jgi:hypothetical protein
MWGRGWLFAHDPRLTPGWLFAHDASGLRARRVSSFAAQAAKPHGIVCLVVVGRLPGSSDDSCWRRGVALCSRFGAAAGVALCSLLSGGWLLTHEGVAVCSQTARGGPLLTLREGWLLALEGVALCSREGGPLLTLGPAWRVACGPRWVDAVLLFGSCSWHIRRVTVGVSCRCSANGTAGGAVAIASIA